MIIALHGDFAWPTMLARDVGDLEPSIDLFWDANGWRRTDREIDRLEAFIRTLDQPPTMIGYSRGGSVIAALSERVEIRAAVVYESPVLDSEGVGGAFPVLMVWNDQGVMSGKRKGQAKIAQQIWKASHPVTEIWGTGRHLRTRPIGHGWDCSLNNQIRSWILKQQVCPDVLGSHLRNPLAPRNSFSVVDRYFLFLLIPMCWRLTFHGSSVATIASAFSASCSLKFRTRRTTIPLRLKLYSSRYMS